nr:hypothetical protein [Tanacetum cinerariifolium]
MYMAKVQEVSLDAVDSGPIFDTKPKQKVQNADHYDVFAIECQHSEQSKSIHKTYLIEQDAQNVLIESVDMNYDSEQIDQNDEDADLAKELSSSSLQYQCKLLALASLLFWQWELILPVGTLTWHFFIIAVQTPGSGISILLAVGIPSTGSGNLYYQWELSTSSGNALCILFPTGTTMVQKSGIQCYNFKEYGHVAKECQKPKRANDATYHKEKMLLYAADNSGPIFDTEPLQREQIDHDDDDDLANERDLLASLIEKLKCEIDDNKIYNKFLETSNKALVDKLK